MARCDIRVFLLLAMILLPGSAVEAKKKPVQKKLVLYIHERRVPPDSTIIVSASPTGNFSGADEFGLIRTFSNILRESSDNTSTILGSQVGIVVDGLDILDDYISFTYFLNANATHQGTIAAHGHVDARGTANRIFAVVGGTGDFLSVTGADESVDDTSPTPSVVSVRNITLTSPYW